MLKNMTSLRHAEAMATLDPIHVKQQRWFFGRIRTQHTIHAKAMSRRQPPSYCGG